MYMKDLLNFHYLIIYFRFVDRLSCYSSVIEILFLLVGISVHLLQCFCETVKDVFMYSYYVFFDESVLFLVNKLIFFPGF